MSLADLRKPKIFGMAIFDISVSIVGLWFMFYMIQTKRGYLPPTKAIKQSLLLAIFMVFPVSIMFHLLFGVNTKLMCDLNLAEAQKCGFLVNK